MSNKTSFKRIALAVVAALGFGALASAPSNAYLTTAGAVVFDLSASTASAAVGETASVTITVGFTSTVANETLSVKFSGSGAGGTPYVMLLKSDSINVSTAATHKLEAPVDTALGASESATVRTNATNTNATAVQQKMTFNVADIANVGTHTYTLSLYEGDDDVLIFAKTFSVTVAANTATVASAATSKMYINRTNEWVEATRLEKDSALVVSAGTTATPVKVGVLHAIINNASDTKTALGNAVSSAITITATGPGLLSTGADPATRAKQITVPMGESALVWSDGSVGTGTFTAYLGSSVDASKVFAQAAKTVVFSGKATTFTPKAVAAVAAGGNLGYSDTTTAGTAIITFTAKDAGGNAVSSADLNTTTLNPTTGKFYAISSDSKVISGASKSNSVECTYTSATVGFTCNMWVLDSGTATITIADSTTVSNAPTKSDAVSYTVAGAAWSGTLAFDKATYAPGERALVTITAKDSAGRNVANGLHNPFFDMKWGTSSPAPTFTKNTDAAAAGGSFADLVAYFTAGTDDASFVNGVDTALVFMPNTAGSYSVTFGQAGETTTVSTVSFSIVDAAEEAANSALDAAQEATDAAIAATDAAILAQEAADEAASAAVAAQETAQAAVDAVTALSAEVTKLVAQLATLQKLLNRVAKRVGVKL